MEKSRYTKYPATLKELQYPYISMQDRYLCYYVSESFSILENMRNQALRRAVLETKIPGVIEVSMGQVAFMVHFDPFRIDKDDLIKEIIAIVESVADISQWVFEPTITELPVWFDDPWSIKCYLEHKEWHQVKDGSISNFKYSAQLNNMTPEEFERLICSRPCWCDADGFVIGIMGLAPMTKKLEEYIHLPKWEKSRPWTPNRGFVWGGSHFAVHPYVTPGGYQLLGSCAVPVFSRERILEPFQESDVLLKVGDIVIIRSIKEDEYKEIRAEVEAGKYKYKRQKRKFYPKDWAEDPDGFCQQLMEEFK